jgi:hypothetical protein
VQGLGDWKAPVCQRQKSAANEAQRNNSFSRNIKSNKKIPTFNLFYDIILRKRGFL